MQPTRASEPAAAAADGPDGGGAPQGRDAALEVHAETPRPSGFADLFHQLNNQLGIILANAELLELKAHDDTSRARAAQVVASVLEALATARTLRDRLGR
jgi:hypothetical protein